MNVVVKPDCDGGYWSLYVDGVCVMGSESFDACDAVRYYLQNPRHWGTSELCEVADRIRQRFERDARQSGSPDGVENVQ